MSPKWSTEAKKAVSLFFRKWNDIDVYVEDTSISTLRIYNEILVRLSGDKFRVERVFPVGSKKNVIQACRDYDSGEKRPSLYVVDGDLDLLCNNKRPSLERLYVQERYCIENFLIDEKSSIEIMYEEKATMDRDTIKALIKYDLFKKDIECFLDLFIIFGAMRKFFPGIKSVSLSLKSFTTGGKKPTVDVAKVNDYIGEMHGYMCEAFGNDITLCEELKLQDQALSNDAVITYVSGKDFLLPALLFHLRGSTRVLSSNDSLKLRLAKYCDLDPFVNFKAALCACSKSM